MSTQLTNTQQELTEIELFTKEEGNLKITSLIETWNYCIKHQQQQLHNLQLENKHNNNDGGEVLISFLDSQLTHHRTLLSSLRTLNTKLLFEEIPKTKQTIKKLREETILQQAELLNNVDDSQSQQSQHTSAAVGLCWSPPHVPPRGETVRKKRAASDPPLKSPSPGGRWENEFELIPPTPLAEKINIQQQSPTIQAVAAVSNSSGGGGVLTPEMIEKFSASVRRVAKLQQQQQTTTTTSASASMISPVAVLNNNNNNNNSLLEYTPITTAAENNPMMSTVTAAAGLLETPDALFRVAAASSQFSIENHQISHLLDDDDEQQQQQLLFDDNDDAEDEFENALSWLKK